MQESRQGLGTLLGLLSTQSTAQRTRMLNAEVSTLDVQCGRQSSIMTFHWAIGKRNQWQTGDSKPITLIFKKHEKRKIHVRV